MGGGGEKGTYENNVRLFRYSLTFDLISILTIPRQTERFDRGGEFFAGSREVFLLWGLPDSPLHHQPSVKIKSASPFLVVPTATLAQSRVVSHLVLGERGGAKIKSGRARTACTAA